MYRNRKARPHARYDSIAAPRCSLTKESSNMSVMMVAEAAAAAATSNAEISVVTARFW